MNYDGYIAHRSQHKCRIYQHKCIDLSRNGIEDNRTIKIIIFTIIYVLMGITVLLLISIHSPQSSRVCLHQLEKQMECDAGAQCDQSINAMAGFHGPDAA